MDKVVHFEIPVDDLPRAKKFYNIFGWHLEDMPGMDYVAVRTVPVDQNSMPSEPGAINGGMFKRTNEVRSPVVAINVDSIDDSLAKVLKAGGKVVTEKKKVAEMGYYAYVSDTEGNILGLWESIQ